MTDEVSAAAPQDSSEVGPHIASMWRDVAGRIEAEARGAITDGTDFLKEHRARYLMRMARLAEAAWWRSTGEGDAFDLAEGPVEIERDFVKP
jgi:hypothetical protein